MRPRSTDIICSLIDASPWDTLNSLSRLDKASSNYARAMRAVKLAIWSRLNGDRADHYVSLAGLAHTQYVNFAFMVLPNMLRHGRSIMRDVSTGTRFVVEYHLGEPMTWSREECASIDNPMLTWTPVARGMCRPARAHMTTRSGFPMFGEIVRGYYVCVVLIGTKCSIIPMNMPDAPESPVVVTCNPLAAKAADSIAQRNQWYEMNVSRHVDSVIGDRVADTPETFAKAIARNLSQERIAWFDRCHPMLA